MIKNLSNALRMHRKGYHSSSKKSRLSYVDDLDQVMSDLEEIIDYLS